MNKLTTELRLYDNEEAVDPELDDSVYNPANNHYRKTTQSLRRMITALATQLRPKHAMIAKLLANGTSSNIHIARRLRCNPNTVAATKRLPDVQKLIGYIRELNLLTEGTRALDREMLLYGIALREELTDPRTSIAAIAEINKMRTDTESAQAKLKQNQTIQDSPTIIIQLADARLLPSPLDNPQLKDVN